MIDPIETRPTVFLVEDNAEMRQSLQWLLESHGYLVVASASPAAALESYDPTRAGKLVEHDYDDARAFLNDMNAAPTRSVPEP